MNRCDPIRTPAFILYYDAENRLVAASGSAVAGFAYDGDGVRVKETSVYKNLAKGTVVTGSVAVTNPDVVANGDTQADSGSGASREYAYTSTTGLQYVRIDLGAQFPVNKLVVWHYNGDGRTYHNTKTQVSADGTNWTTVFDSAVSGEYAETLAGKTHTFTQQNVRYVRDYLNGSTANSGNHWVEIEVWGTTTTAYVGDYFEWNGSAQTMTRYYSAGGVRVAVRNGNGSGINGLVYLLGDHLGSTSLTADPVDGDKLSELRFKAWGETRYALTNAPTDRRYTGQVEESQIGLYWIGSRWYDPALSRWVQPDVIVPETVQGVQAWDRYAYVNNNSLNYIDPTGHDLEQIIFNKRGELPKQTKPPRINNDPWFNDPNYSAWQRLREGSACTACHVTHWNGRIPDNSQLDPKLVEYYRSLDPLAAIVHSYALYQLGQLGNVAQSSPPLTTNRAVDLHDAIPNPIARRMTTTGVLTTEEGYTLVGSSDAYLNPAQQSLLLKDEIEVMGQVGVHAEYKLLSAATSSGLTPQAMFVSRFTCPACQALLDFFNIPYFTP